MITKDLGVTQNREWYPVTLMTIGDAQLLDWLPMKLSFCTKDCGVTQMTIGDTQLLKWLPMILSFSSEQRRILDTQIISNNTHWPPK